MNDLHEICHASVGKMIKFKGTNGNEYDKEQYGKPITGTGRCISAHDSHGLCIIVRLFDGVKICIDPTEVEIIE